MFWGLGVITCLLFLLYQDLKYRAVFWLTFPVLLLALIAFGYGQVRIESLVDNTLINLGFIVIQLLLLSLYFSVKEQKIVNITRKYLGWGDVLFLFTVAFYLSPLNYLLFYISSLLLVLLFSVIAMRKAKEKEYLVPLAGLQAAIFALFFVVDWKCSFVNLQSDDWLIRYFAS